MLPPYYIIDERRLRDNLALIADVARRSGAEIILAFKAYALWKTFPIFREYIHSTTASSLSEARLAFEEFGSPAHTYSPAYTEGEIGAIARLSSHLTFNSLSQYAHLHAAALAANPSLRLGLRVNPRYSEVTTAIYNPCAPGTRFGVAADRLPERLPEQISGLHVHCHCESGADVFARSLAHIEEQFAPWLPQVEWINFGGGHLMTRNDYDVDGLVELLQGFRRRWPHLHVVLEPGSAFGWQTGELVASVVDIVEDSGISTAILDVSFTCHMPDCLEMPYWPEVRGAEHVDPSVGSLSVRSEELLVRSEMCCPQEAKHIIPNSSPTTPNYNQITPNSSPTTPNSNRYRLGGNSCLSGDYMGDWLFAEPLHVGSQVVFEDMLHYTTVKTNMFNGVGHPSILMRKLDGSEVVLRSFGYEDYKNRMD